MFCPYCNRNLTSTLSVCIGCGTMLNDSVREGLALKIASQNKIKKSEEIQLESTKHRLDLPVKTEPVTMFAPPNKTIKNNTHSIRPNIKNSQTSEILTKPTSQTLVDFQNKNARLPDWRLQLQNSVRKRLDKQNAVTSDAKIRQPAAPRLITPTTKGATALKYEIIEKQQPVQAENSIITNALRRIEESRKKYLATSTPIEAQKNESQSIVKQFPGVLQNQDQEQLTQTQVKPNLVKFSFATKTEPKAEKYDTAKLPPMPLPSNIQFSHDKKSEPKKIAIDLNYVEDIYRTVTEEKNYYQQKVIEKTHEIEDIEDYAPISLRFNAAIFDFLIGSFLSLILLSPFMLLKGNFFSLEGFFAFFATLSIVMFIYLTTTIGFLGRTFGMRLFALEIIDIEENDYPMLHQAAVSSSVYLLSLVFGGVGFLTMLFNSEKRAAHDLLSKTIVIKEYK